MSEQVLFVDDDPNLLAACRRTFHTRYDIQTALGGPEGLELIGQSEPFAVVVADMRMPGMDGIAFLARVREASPDSVRMMLTGNADLDTAIRAVNDGEIFRFLTKPCPQDTLLRAIENGVQQYRLITAERQLLEQTLNGSMKVLTDILSLIRPKAFGRSSRLRWYVRHMVQHLRLPNAWEYEMAAMLSQLGCVSLPDELLDKRLLGESLDPRERLELESHPDIARRLLAKIPRLERVAEIIACQQKPCPWAGREAMPLTERAPVPVGGQILKVALDFDQWLSTGVKPELALDMLRNDPNTYDPDIVESLATIEVQRPDYAASEVRLSEIKPGMVLDQDVRAANGHLLVTCGQEVTPAIREHLLRWAERMGVEEPIRVLAPNLQAAYLS